MSRLCGAIRSLSSTALCENIYFAKSRTAIARKPSGGRRQIFENATEKKIFKDAMKHHPYPNQRDVNKLTKYYAHHGIATRQWDFETNWDHMKRNILFDQRIKAGVKPHSNLDRTRVVKNLQMAGSALNSEILANLALHEPRTFKCLVEVAERFDHETVHAENGADIPKNSLTRIPVYL